MPNTKRQFRYASGEVAKVGDVISATLGMESTPSTASVLRIHGDWIDYAITSEAICFHLSEGDVTSVSGILRSRYATLIERGVLDEGNLRISTAVERLK